MVLATHFRMIILFSSGNDLFATSVHRECQFCCIHDDCYCRNSTVDFRLATKSKLKLEKGKIIVVVTFLGCCKTMPWNHFYTPLLHLPPKCPCVLFRKRILKGVWFVSFNKFDLLGTFLYTYFWNILSHSPVTTRSFAHFLSGIPWKVIQTARSWNWF